MCYHLNMEDQENPTVSKRWIACPIEEEYLGSDRKQKRKERKEKSSRDRSKFKKTDKSKYTDSLQKEIKERVVDQELFFGRVLSVTSQGIVVDCDREIYVCMVRGLLKREKTQVKTLVAVGDIVRFAKMPDNEGMIVDVEPRKSILSRADNLSRKKEHLIAVNIDQVLITSSVVIPPLKPALIDRYIIAARKGGMRPVIIVNKVDLLDSHDFDDEARKEQRDLLEKCRQAYKEVGISFFEVSVESRCGLDELKEAMRDQTSVFSGQSGTGKSSLINELTGLNLPVGDTVKQTRKGAHTTTQTRLVPLDCGGFCVDTPGIKSFGLWDLAQEEIQQYFPEIEKSSSFCRFPNCTHTHEEKCQVRKDVEDGNISPLRFESYLSLIESVVQKHHRR